MDSETWEGHSPLANDESYRELSATVAEELGRESVTNVTILFHDTSLTDAEVRIEGDISKEGDTKEVLEAAVRQLQDSIGRFPS